MDTRFVQFCELPFELCVHILNVCDSFTRCLLSLSSPSLLQHYRGPSFTGCSFAAACACAGYLNLLRWALNEHFPVNEWAIWSAAEQRHLDVLRFLVETETRLPVDSRLFA